MARRSSRSITPARDALRAMDFKSNPKAKRKAVPSARAAHAIKALSLANPFAYESQLVDTGAGWDFRQNPHFNPAHARKVMKTAQLLQSHGIDRSRALRIAHMKHNPFAYESQLVDTGAGWDFRQNPKKLSRRAAKGLGGRKSGRANPASENVDVTRLLELVAFSDAEGPNKEEYAAYTKLLSMGYSARDIDMAAQRVRARGRK
jgi:hypothetical protein